MNKPPENTWLRYRHTPNIEMRPYVPGEDLTDIDTTRMPHPQDGDLVARDPDHPERMWMVNAHAYSGYTPVYTTMKEKPSGKDYSPVKGAKPVFKPPGVKRK